MEGYSATVFFKKKNYIPTGASATAPTQQVSLQKMKEENAFLKAKIKFLEDKCKDIESERDFLRSSLTNGKLFYL